MATVSTGLVVSPNTHSWGVLTGMLSRQPAVRYSDWGMSSGGGRMGLLAETLTPPTSAAAPGYSDVTTFPFHGSGSPMM